MKLIMLLLQLALVVIVVVVAAHFAPEYNLIPREILNAENKPLTGSQTIDVIQAFLIVHLAFYLTSLSINKKAVFSTFQRTLRELHFVVLANSAASVYMFTLTTVPFSANFYLYIYVLGPLLYVPIFFLVNWIRHRPQSAYSAWIADLNFGRELKAFAFTRWTAITLTIMLTPAFMAFAYKANRDFADVVNYVRVTWNTNAESTWSLIDAFPNQLFEQPMDIRFSRTDDTKFYVLSRTGRLYRISTQPEFAREIVLDISDVVSEPNLENGAISFALHPDFGDTDSEMSGTIFVYYTHEVSGLQQNRLSKFDISLPTLSERAQSETILTEQDREPSGMHNGGSVLFDSDGFLYLSVGDFLQGFSNSQLIDNAISGGIFRIDVDMRGEPISRPIRNQPVNGRTASYYIPTDNPFVGVENALEEFWALGFRNPFRMSMDHVQGDIWLGDVGRDAYEEIDRVTKGANGEWPFREGPQTVDGDTGIEAGATLDQAKGDTTPPYYYYAQTALERAVIGGFVYRGSLFPEFYGHYIFADNQSGIVRQLDLADSERKPQLLARASQLAQQGITSLTETPSGEIYITVLGSKTKDSGQIVKLTRGSDAPTIAPGSDQFTFESVSSKFDQICSRCHGLDGKGLEVAGIDVEIPDFSSADWQNRVTDEQIISITNEGGEAVGRSANMPAWEGLFADPEFEFLVRKIRSFENGTGASND